jgi:hypothetical protein
MTPSQVYDSTLEDLEAWADAADRLWAERELGRLSSLYVSQFAIHAKEGGNAFRKHQDRLTEIANGNAR